MKPMPRKWRSLRVVLFLLVAFAVAHVEALARPVARGGPAAGGSVRGARHHERGDVRRDRRDTKQDVRGERREGRSDVRDERREHHERREDRWRRRVGTRLTLSAFRALTCRPTTVNPWGPYRS